MAQCVTFSVQNGEEPPDDPPEDPTGGFGDTATIALLGIAALIYISQRKG